MALLDSGEPDGVVPGHHVYRYSIDCIDAPWLPA
jgi:hypothetical protein